MKDMKKIIESDCPAEEKLDSVQSKFTTLVGIKPVQFDVDDLHVHSSQNIRKWNVIC